MPVPIPELMETPAGRDEFGTPDEEVEPSIY
ncbi:hypothetical protein Htur_3537 [Haloterrigena turkmenica DSM 5511]|uniref:Uncharacterized protein n=1 Tax=Haloterrigena turkmenica (strain ATCC 51198 / DSM 5511 / JCM 9101 / NCIMB 13204 / VKM B-1734 / 4k) TaxID=543526 RepID=D2RR03_HALTV|nr:hypothetical protein Htur_3537 [Haloterrigena turkmenica DSM 5511]